MNLYEEPPDVLSFQSDTQFPQTVVPIFYLHSGDRPFCANPSCICHKSNAALKNILLDVINRKLRLFRFRQERLYGKESSND